VGRGSIPRFCSKSVVGLDELGQECISKELTENTWFLGGRILYGVGCFCGEGEV